jgi:hypothetical protein
MWDELWVKRPWLRALLEQRGWSFVVRWSRRGLLRPRSLHGQYWLVVRHADDHTLVFFPVGRFIEFYGPQRFLAMRTLGLRSALLPCGSYAFTAGFPKRLSVIYLLRAIRQGVTVFTMRQVSWQLECGPAKRVPCAVLLPREADGSAEIRQIDNARWGRNSSDYASQLFPKWVRSKVYICGSLPDERCGNFSSRTRAIKTTLH